MSIRTLWYIAVPVVAATTVALTLWLTTFSGSYTPPAPRELGLEELDLPTYARRSSPEVSDDRQGVMILDTLHFNHFLPGELEPLLTKVINLGYELEFFGDRLAAGFLGETERVLILEEALRGADSMLTVAPIVSYTDEESAVVRRFVEKGGRLVLAGDPTRVRTMNALATALAFNYEEDFLFNVKEHDANYRNVVFRDFAEHALTQGLTEIVLYTSGSITGAADALVWGDNDTRSSTREAASVLAPMALAMDGQVVALADASFIEAPYDKVLDNDRLLANLADFLTSGTRTFSLEDFPGFLAADVVVTATSPAAIDAATGLAGSLSSGDHRVPLQSLDRPTVDTVFVGLYDDQDVVAHHLQSAGVVFGEGRISSPTAPSLSQRRSGIVVFDSRGGRNVVVVLGSSEFELSSLVGQLLNGRYRGGLVSPNLGLYDFD